MTPGNLSNMETILFLLLVALTTILLAVGHMKSVDPTANMHRDLWKALRSVQESGSAGSPEARDLLMERGLIEWTPEGRHRLTAAGEKAMRERRT